MATTTVTERSKELKEAVKTNDIDAAIKNVKKLDGICTMKKCKAKTSDFAITCKHCGGRFCPTHCLPEVHGCGEAVRRDERRKYMHPEPKTSNEKHERAATRLQMKLKQMQLERKSKKK